MWNKIKQLYKRFKYRKAYNRLNDLVKYESNLSLDKTPIQIDFDAEELIDSGFNYDLHNFNLSGLSPVAKEKVISIVQQDRLSQIKKRNEHLERLAEAQLAKLKNDPK